MLETEVNNILWVSTDLIKKHQVPDDPSLMTDIYFITAQRLCFYMEATMKYLLNKRTTKP